MALNDSPPGGWVSGCCLPCFYLRVKIFQASFRNIFKPQIGTTLIYFASVELWVEKLSRQSIIAHLKKMAKPASFLLQYFSCYRWKTWIIEYGFILDPVDTTTQTLPPTLIYSTTMENADGKQLDFRRVMVTIGANRYVLITKNKSEALTDIRYWVHRCRKIGISK